MLNMILGSSEIHTYLLKVKPPYSLRCIWKRYYFLLNYKQKWASLSSILFSFYQFEFLKLFQSPGLTGFISILSELWTRIVYIIGMEEFLFNTK